MSKKGFKEIFRGGFVEAEIVADLLRSGDIEVYIENEILGTVMPWVVSPAGAAPVKIYVREEDFETAEEFIKSEKD